METNRQQALLDYLFMHITPNKREKFLRAVQFRTRHLTVVLEDIYQPHNASAVLRSCDCFGIHDVHIIENRNRFEVVPHIVRGSTKWIDLHHYNQESHNTVSCFRQLKDSGYQVVGVTPHASDRILEEWDPSQKAAFVFGNEHVGLSDEAVGACDAFIRVPMHGFTESLNVSVCAAICLYDLTRRLHASGVSWQLDDREKADVLIEWCKRTLRNGETFADDFLEQQEAGKG